MTSPPRPTLSHDHPPRRLRVVSWVVAAVLVASLGVAGWVWGRPLYRSLFGEQCQATALGESVTFDPEQMNHASTIVLIALKRDLPARAGTIAVATAIQESKLRNITYGDRDSVGLFQQRPSQGWGSVEELTDPVYATNAFYDALVKVDGWQDMRITEIAQEVQRSAFPEAYADHEHEGRAIASSLAGHSPAGFGCRLEEASESGDPAKISAALKEQTGMSAAGDGEGVLAVTATSEQFAWAAGSWAVGQASARQITAVQVGSKQWVRGDQSYEWTDAADPIPAQQVRITYQQ